MAMGIVAAVIIIAIPTVGALQRSYQSSGVGSMIAAALGNARALAAKEQKYAAVRFQPAGDPCQSDPLKVPQYMITLIYNSEPNNTAVSDSLCFSYYKGLKPVKLPVEQIVLDMYSNNAAVADNTDIQSDAQLTDAATFTIVFSPAGNLVQPEDVLVDRWHNNDDVFNDAGAGMFVRDWQTERGRNSFLICDRKKLAELPANDRYSRYLQRHKDEQMTYINAYTGSLMAGGQ